ncbi:MAG: tetratricopeptide repeat protein [Alphaproteobacteria bacterium]|nr:tetratricopeptide repeat protein [Alphaproteobacteria bacterium]
MDGSEYSTVRQSISDENGNRIRAQIRPTLAGNYLSSRFAQRHHDWAQATDFVDGVLKYAPDDLGLTKRAMVLGMGAGQYDLAIEKASDVLKNEPDNALALLFKAMEAYKNKDYKTGASIIKKMPEGSLSAFIMPLLNSWSQAAIGVNDTDALKNSALHIYHAILISDYLEAHESVKELLEKSLNARDISTDDLTRIAGIYAHIGDTGKARELYIKVLMVEPDNVEVTENLGRIDNGEEIKIFDMVDSPEAGLSEAMYDMARVLYSDYSDESARIFAHLSLFLNPDKMDATLLLGHIATRYGRIEEAIAFYKSIPAGHPKYFDARRMAANLLEEQGDFDGALAALQALVDNSDNLDALVQIGDLYRRNEDYKKAVTVYNKVEKKLGGDIPADYWQLHYVRGMSYEQMGEWDKAEADLLAAIEFQPDNPFVLNYLGYSWADQGLNLEKSKKMIERAVRLRPQDGYITDSLGWVLYRVGEYEAAVPHLERAVELLPYDPTVNDHLGDAYWKVGRRLEARFQWERTRNHTDDPALIDQIADKMQNGLDQPTPVSKEADAKHVMPPSDKETIEQ